MAIHPKLDEIIQCVLPVAQEFHRKGRFASHAATINLSGDLVGRALTTDGTTGVSVHQAIEQFETGFARLAQLGEIEAAGIFYHSPGFDQLSSTLPPATSRDECRSLVALLEHASGESLYMVIPYSGEAPAIQYADPSLVRKPARVFLSQSHRV